jgi:hypothetical protein
MVKLLMAASAAFFLVCAPVYAQTDAEIDAAVRKVARCTPLEVAEPKIKEISEAHEVLSGDRKDRALAVLKEMGAPADTDTVVIGIVVDGNGDVSLVLWAGTNNALCGKVTIPDAAMMKVFQHIYGYRA